MIQYQLQIAIADRWMRIDPRSRKTQFRAKRSRGRLTEEEYEFIARDIMAKPPMTGY